MTTTIAATNHRPRRRRATTAAVAGTVLALLVSATPDATARTSDDLVAATRATGQYHSTGQAARDGFARPPAGPLHECIGIDDDQDPTNDQAAMGFHWINGARVTDAELTPASPEVLVYEPRPNGQLRLVALEYVVFETTWEAAHGEGSVPRLFGLDMIYTPAPNRYELPAFYQRHVWLWKHNPAGQFASMNPTASCAFANAVD